MIKFNSVECEVICISITGVSLGLENLVSVNAPISGVGSWRFTYANGTEILTTEPIFFKFKRTRALNKKQDRKD